MSTDKTMADVQPGGRVRLGDVLPPLPKMQRFTNLYGETYAYSAEQMRDYARAALSAQPSPGGQGDAVRCGKCKDRGYVDVDVDVDDSGSSIGNVEACPHCALSARQPVGEPVPFAVESKAFETHAASRDLNLVQHPLHYLFLDPVTVEARRAWKAALAFAPPAQAVDLWQPIETAPKNGSSMLLGYVNSAGNWRTVRGRWFSAERIEMEWENADDFEAGWYEESAEADDIPNVWPTTPTHWQPLPAAPRVDSQAVGNG